MGCNIDGLAPWFKIRSDLWLGAMPKCGTRSIRFAVAHKITGKTYNELLPSKIHGEFPWFKNIEPGSGHRTIVVRNPVDRFRSLWRNQCRDCSAGISPRGTRREITPEQLFDMCKRQDNQHYYKQTHLLKFRVDEIIKLETLSDWWLEHWGEPLINHNVTIKLPSDDRGITPGLLAKVEGFYGDDMKLYMDAR